MTLEREDRHAYDGPYRRCAVHNLSSIIVLGGGTTPREVVILASTRHMEATLFCHATP
jgi:hypothetical protein